MPCSHCGRNASKPGVTPRVRYCVCQACNVCHKAFACQYKDGWWEEMIFVGRTPAPVQPARKPMLPGQSPHGEGYPLM